MGRPAGRSLGPDWFSPHEGYEPMIRKIPDFFTLSRA